MLIQEIGGTDFFYFSFHFHVSVNLQFTLNPCLVIQFYETKQNTLRHIKVMLDGVLFEIVDLFFEGVHTLSPTDII